jgi:carbon storage regulator CsrA
MLVLSRRLNEKLLFPSINTTIQIVSSKRGIVRLGIEAPPEVKVLREEIAHRETALAEPVTISHDQPLKRQVSQLRDRLLRTGIGLGTVQLLLDTGNSEAAQRVLGRIRDEFQLLRRGVEGELDEAPAKKATPSRQQKHKALLVEDDIYQRELLAGFLRMVGLEVDTAGDGADALDYLHSRPQPDVVLLDMGLPRCDGATMVRHIRRDPTYSGLRIYAVTSSRPEQFDLAQGSGGIDRWFQKPLDPAVLLENLKQELDTTPCS